MYIRIYMYTNIHTYIHTYTYIYIFSIYTYIHVFMYLYLFSRRGVRLSRSMPLLLLLLLLPPPPRHGTSLALKLMTFSNCWCCISEGFNTLLALQALMAALKQMALHKKQRLQSTARPSSADGCIEADDISKRKRLAKSCKKNKFR